MIVPLQAAVVTHSQLEPVLTKKSTADPFPAPTRVSQGAHAQAHGSLPAPMERRAEWESRSRLSCMLPPRCCLVWCRLSEGGAHTGAV